MFTQISQMNITLEMFPDQAIFPGYSKESSNPILNII